jgi:hypothetical protein
VLGYVGEGEVARVQRVEQDERCDCGGGEGADDRVARGLVEPAGAPSCAATEPAITA